MWVSVRVCSPCGRWPLHRRQSVLWPLLVPRRRHQGAVCSLCCLFRCLVCVLIALWWLLIPRPIRFQRQRSARLLVVVVRVDPGICVVWCWFVRSRSIGLPIGVVLVHRSIRILRVCRLSTSCSRSSTCVPRPVARCIVVVGGSLAAVWFVYRHRSRHTTRPQ